MLGLTCGQVLHNATLLGQESELDAKQDRYKAPEETGQPEVDHPQYLPMQDSVSGTGK